MNVIWQNSAQGITAIIRIFNRASTVVRVSRLWNPKRECFDDDPVVSWPAGNRQSVLLVREFTVAFQKAGSLAEEISEPIQWYNAEYMVLGSTGGHDTVHQTLPGNHYQQIMETVRGYGVGAWGITVKPVTPEKKFSRYRRLG